MNKLEKILPRMISPSFGLINYLSEIKLQPDEPDFFIAVAEYQDPLLVSTCGQLSGCGASPMSQQNPHRQATGAGLSREAALWATIGEAVERYAGSAPDMSQLLYASYAEIENQALDLSNMILFADWQYESAGFPFSRFDPQKPLGWVKGWNLTKDEEALLPARFVYSHYPVKFHHENLDKGYSTGLASGASLPSALCTAIREVIERDAYSCFWLTGITPPSIDLEKILETLPKELQKLFTLKHIEYNLRDISTEFSLTTVLSTIRFVEEAGFASGASCHLKAGKALEKATIESFHTLNWILDLKRRCVPAKVTKQVEDFSDHVSYYLDSQHKGNLDFLYAQQDLSSSNIQANDFINETSTWETLAKLVSELKQLGFDVFFADVTTQDLLSLGFRVVKAIIPGMQPLSAGYGYQHLDPRRLRQFAARMGYDLPQQFNTNLHPFP